MTRFARAKGSKSSNERTPEDSTPWEVMKEQLLQTKKESEEAKKREEAEKQRIENYENFLKEHRSQKRKATWCDFPENVNQKPKVSQVTEPPSKKKNKQVELESVSTNNVLINSGSKKSKKKNKNKKSDESLIKTPENGIDHTESGSKITTQDNASNISPKKKKKQQKLALEEVSSTNDNGIKQMNFDSKETIQNNATNVSPKKKKKQKKPALEEALDTNTNENEIDQDDSGSKETNQDIGTNVSSKKKNKKQNKTISEQVSETNQSENNQTLSVQSKKNKKLKFNAGENGQSYQENGKDANTKQNFKNNKSNPKKNKKLVDGVPVRRKPIDDHSFQLIINGKEVELVRFDGFPIMKKDAERLHDLKKNMISKGIPKSEVNRTLKLERRRAEKALARLKRDVCYNCRKGGHNLSDCPELKTKIPGVGAPDGVCFKCGSTEHRQFECKVQKDKEFRFATCFICKEPGHIARQCPDNPKGLYPNGGGCKLCGDVTHLRKDCPTTMGSKEETSIKLQTLESSDNLEGIGQKTDTYVQDTIKKPKKIKF